MKTSFPSDARFRGNNRNAHLYSHAKTRKDHGWALISRRVHLHLSILYPQATPHHRDTTRHFQQSNSAAHIYEKLTNFGSFGRPSAPMLFFLNALSMNSLRASSNPTPLRFMIFCTSRLPFSSSPDRSSPSVMLFARLKFVECSPASTSSRNDVGTGE